MTGHVGVDPGANGAVCVKTEDGFSVYKYGLGGAGSRIVGDGDIPERPKRLVVEKVSASPVMSPSAAFSFGRAYQRALIDFPGATLAVPQSWQSHWQGDLAGVFGAERKNLLWEIARRYVPSVPKYAADAVLIAVYAEETDVG